MGEAKDPSSGAVQLTLTARGMKRFLVVVLIAAALGGLVYGGVVLARPGDPFSGLVDHGRWQAVSLSDGRIYLGHLRDSSGEFYELRDAFFVQQVSQANGAGERRVLPLTAKPEGPEGRALIAKRFVVEVENLRPDSEAVKAIEQLRSGN